VKYYATPNKYHSTLLITVILSDNSRLLRRLVKAS